MKAFFRFFHYLSLPKLVNLGLLFISWQCSRVFGKAVHWGMPATLSVEPTTACNLRCPECPSGLRSFSRPTGTLNEALFTKIIDETHRHLLFLIFYFQGEPFIHPFFLDLVQKAHKKRIYTITSTNGHFLHPDNCRKTILSGLDKLIISIDGTTQETYGKYRKEGSLESVLQGARNMVKCRKEMHSASPLIVFQFIVMRHNEHQIEEVYRLAREIGIDQVSVKSAQVYDFENGSELIPHQSRYSRYKQAADGRFTIKNPLENRCWKLWHASVVTWDGRVVPCCFDKDARYEMGQVQQDPFKNIWQSPAYRQFRSRLVRGRKDIDICRNCTEGTLTGD